MKRKITWRRRHWFDQGEGHSPRFYRNEPIITDVEIQPRVRLGWPIPRWLRREWDYVVTQGVIYADQVGIFDTVWPESAGTTPPGLR